MPNPDRSIVVAPTGLSNCNDTITGSETCMHGLCFCQAMGFHEDKIAAFCVSCDPRKLCFWTSACDPKRHFRVSRRRGFLDSGPSHYHKPTVRRSCGRSPRKSVAVSTLAASALVQGNSNPLKSSEQGARLFIDTPRRQAADGRRHGQERVHPVRQQPQLVHP